MQIHLENLGAESKLGPLERLPSSPGPTCALGMSWDDPASWSESTNLNPDCYGVRPQEQSLPKGHGPQFPGPAEVPQDFPAPMNYLPSFSEQTQLWLSLTLGSVSGASPEPPPDYHCSYTIADLAIDFHEDLAIHTELATDLTVTLMPIGLYCSEMIDAADPQVQR